MESSDSSTAREEHDLIDVLTDVLGNLAFMVGDDEPVEDRAESVWLECEISYHGSVNASVTCWCTRDFAIQLAANLLGIEPDESDAQAAAEDSLREFMNVFVGQLVTAWHGTTDVYTLSIPAISQHAGPPSAPAGGDAAPSQLSISGELFYCAYRALSRTPG